MEEHLVEALVPYSTVCHLHHGANQVAQGNTNVVYPLAFSVFSGFSFFNGECLDDGIKETGLCKPSVPEFYTYRAMSSDCSFLWGSCVH